MPTDDDGLLCEVLVRITLWNVRAVKVWHPSVVGESSNKTRLWIRQSVDEMVKNLDLMQHFSTGLIAKLVLKRLESNAVECVDECGEGEVLYNGWP